MSSSPAAPWGRVCDLYEQAERLPPADREAFLRGAAEREPDLRDLLERLLGSGPPPDDFLATPGSSALSSLGEAAAPRLSVGGEFAGYVIREIVGSGGTSVVYRAEQQRPRREVALKVLRGLAISARNLQRFEHEAELLARLKHPNIATVYEADTADTPLGPQPFIAMEFVTGSPITRHATNKRLDPTARLRLLLQVCAAVQHAHQRGVIHRDLKPGNILVDADGTPKILDFGVARLVSGDAPHTQVTRPGDLIGTLAYMSPEQAAGASDQIDARSDIYALGVILYELLAGRLPYSVANLPLPDAVRVIRERDPDFSGDAVKLLRGDLATIVSMALQKDPARRYASAAALGDDIERALENEPILARQPSAAYQVRKLIARHKLPFALAAALCLAVVSFAVVATVQAIRISTERDNAVSAQVAEAQARREAEKVSDFFLMDLFEVTDPQKANVEKLTAREVLDKGAERIKEKFEGQPETQATLMLSMGRVYDRLGLLPSARELMESALAMRRDLFDEESTEVADVKHHLARVLGDIGEPDAAERLQNEALQTRRRLLGPDDASVAACLERLADLLKQRGAHAEAEPYVREALAIYRRRTGSDSGEVAACLGSLAGIRCHQGQYEEAEQFARQALEMNERVFGETHPAVAQSLSDLGWVLQNSGEFREAIPVLERAVRIDRVVYGDKSLGLARDLYSLGRSYNWHGRIAESEAVWREALAIRRELVGSDTAAVAKILEEIAYRCLGKRFDYDGAASLYREALEIRRRLYDKPTEQEAWGLCDASLVFLRALQYEEADRVSREGYELACETMDEKSVFRPYCQYYRSIVLRGLGRYNEAELMMRGALERYEALAGAGHTGVEEMRVTLGELLCDRGKYEQAELMIRQAIEVFEARKGDDLYLGLDKLGQVLSAQGDYDGALRAYDRVLGRKTWGADHPYRALTLFHLAELHHRQLEFDEAERRYEESLRMYLKFLKRCDPQVLSVRVGLAKLHMDLGEFDRAEAELRTALDDQIGVVGEDHPDVARTECVLGACLLASGAVDEGQPLFDAGFQRLKAEYPTHHHYIREAVKLADTFLSVRP